MIFLDEEHEKIYRSCIERDSTKERDNERKSLFFLLTLDKTTRQHIDRLYDFKNHWIKIESIDESWQTSGTLAVTRFAFNLYNGYKEGSNVLDVFSSIDRDSFEYLFEAILIRFNMAE